MRNPHELVEAFVKAIHERNPEELVVISHLTFQEKRDLRNALSSVALDPADQEELIGWAWNDNPAIAEAVRALILLFGYDLTIKCFERFINDAHLSAPFELGYNSSEGEFHVDLPDVPGRGVCRSGRDNTSVIVLERAHQKMYPKLKTS